jgi:tRNA threonylcarbamoyl adenosine modification protein YjeE
MAHPPGGGGVLVDEPGLIAWGREFGRKLRPGAVVALRGELGAGKTTLVRAIAEGLGVEGGVTSPTFALVHRYDGLVPVWHVDAYRLKPGDDVRDLGLADAEGGVVLIEWPERLGSAAPGFTHAIHLEHADDGSKRALSVA